MPKTDDNLREAFAGESQANRRYLFFAAKAEKEGLKQAARLFRAAAEAAARGYRPCKVCRPARAA